MNVANQWGPAILVALTVAIGILFSNSRINDLRLHMDGRLDDLKDFIRSEISRLEGRIAPLEHPIHRS